MSKPKGLPDSGHQLPKNRRTILNDFRSSKVWSPQCSRHVYFDRRGLFIRIASKHEIEELVEDGYITVQQRGLLHLYQRSRKYAPRPR